MPDVPLPQPKGYVYIITTIGKVDTLHRDPTEKCTDDRIEKAKTVDEFHAERLLLTGDVRPCETCIRGNWG